MNDIDKLEKHQPPLISSNQILPEITLRAVIIGIILTIILAAANGYLGLKVGQTISASIPAAIISMGILRFFRNSNVLENTMVQTMASVGEALMSGIAYTLPALIILHIWDRFAYWQTFMITLTGGILGVLFTIPLRRALLRDKTLRFPEGIAITNVLKASETKEKNDLKELIVGGAIGAVISLFQAGFQVLRDGFQYWIKVSDTIFGFGLGLSPALIAAGYIVGISVSISLFSGIVIGWIVGIPVLSWVYGIPTDTESVNNMAMILWRAHVRYIGVGTMLLGALWTLITLIKPIGHSIITSVKTLQQAKKMGGSVVERTERDIPINYIFWAVMILLIPIFFIISNSIIPADASISQTFKSLTVGFSTFYVLVGGFVFCSIAAYFAGLVGSTNTPVSGLMVSSVLILCLIFLAFLTLNNSIHGNKLLGIVMAVGTTTMIAGAIGISTDTIQDLKVGQLLGTTPWKQQVMLLVGVVVSSLVAPLILELLYNAYGIGGVFPRPNMEKTQMLAAPQAGLMAAIAEGVYNHSLQWSMIIIGAIVAVFCIITDEIAKLKGHRFPVLAVGLGIYLPLESSVPLVIGGVLSYIVHLRLKKLYNPHDTTSESKINSHRHRGLLLACGMVAGASIMGVILAIPFAIYQRTDALRIMPVQLEPIASTLSIIVTFLLCAYIYRVVLKKNT